MENPLVYFREKAIINGQVVKDIELEKEITPEEEIIKGHMNDQPIEMVIHRRSRKTHRTKHHKKEKRSRRRMSNKK